jgi:hypothetical protein
MAKIRSKKNSKSTRSAVAILEAEDIRHFDKDLRLMSRDELAEHFAAQSSGRILLVPLIKNTIWQAFEFISTGKAPLIMGNIRTFWYLWVKPVLAHIEDDADAKTDPYDVMIRLFAEMVLDLKLFRYSDFDFTDENWENRRIGPTKPEVLIFAEKSGWIRFLRELHEEFGVSVLALGGAPSALTSEYTARDIRAVLKGGPSVHLIGIVDYDPSGDIIANAFRDQLAATGLPSSTLTTIIHPKHYTEEEIEIFRFPLPKKEKTKLEEWMKRTGGINGKPYGLESESMPRERLKDLIQEAIVGAKTKLSSPRRQRK